MRPEELHARSVLILDNCVGSCKIFWEDGKENLEENWSTTDMTQKLQQVFREDQNAEKEAEVLRISGNTGQENTFVDSSIGFYLNTK